MQIKSGIYKFTNKINNKIYIGSSNNVVRRNHQHIFDLKNNNHHNKHLQNAWNKYGENNFEFSVMEECLVDELEKREQFWMDFYRCYDREIGYNNDTKAFNREKSEETKKKLSEINKGKITSEEVKEKLRQANIGKKHSIETKEKMSKSNKRFWYGKKFSKETIEKLLISQKGKHSREKNGSFDLSVYTFKNTSNNEVFNGLRYDFYKKYNLNDANVCGLLKGKRKSYKDWILISKV